MTTLLLVDSRIPQYSELVSAIKSDIDIVPFNSATDTLSGILANISAIAAGRQFSTVGIVQEGSDIMVEYKIVQNQRPALIESIESWTDIQAFFTSLKTVFGIQTIDLISCMLWSNTGFADAMTQLEARIGVNIRASTNRTGNLAQGGDWNQESDNVNIRDIYFTDAIAQFTHLLVGSDDSVYVTYDPMGAYNPNGVVAREIYVTYPINSNIRVRAPLELTRPGYLFLGWLDPHSDDGYYNQEGGYTQGRNNLIRDPGYIYYSVVSNINLYAVWHKTTITVSYRANYATSGSIPELRVYPVGSFVVVAGTGGLAKTGCTFGGWDDGEATRNPGYVYTDVSQDIILRAIWTPPPAIPQISVSYNTNGATSGFAPKNERYNVGSNFTVAGQGSLKRVFLGKNLYFGGWNDGTAIRSPGYVYTNVTKSITLTAIWTLITHDVVYNGNGCTGILPASVPLNPTGSTSVTIAGVGTLAKTGYVFGGWKDVSGMAYNPGTTYSISSPNGGIWSADLLLTAVWNIPTISVTYNANGATSGSVPASASYNSGSSVSVAGSGSLAKTGYTFGGWNDGTAIRSSGHTYSNATQNITLTAVWNAITITVIYNTNGATSGSAPATASYNYGSPVSVAGSGSLAKTGHTFGGWNDGTAIRSPGHTYSNATQNITLTAVWNAITITVTYYAYGATSGSAPESASYNTGSSVSIAGSGSLTKTGFTFGGWNDGTMTWGAGETFSNVTRNITMTPIWNQSVVTITYDANGASGTPPATLSYAIGSNIETFLKGGIEKTGYDFGGWFDETTIRPEGYTYINVTQDMTLTAVWRRTGYTYLNRTEDLNATMYNNSSVMLSWTGDEFASSYEVYQDNSLNPIETLPGGGTTMVHGLTNGQLYTFRVKAIGDGSEYLDSDYSNRATIVPEVMYQIDFVAEPEEVFGVGPVSYKTIANSSITLPDEQELARVGYIFDAWVFINEYGTPSTYYSGEQVTVSRDMVFRTKWRPVATELAATANLSTLTTVVQQTLSDGVLSPQNITRELLQNQAMTSSETVTPAATAANVVGVLNNAGGLNSAENITQVANTLKATPAGTDGALAALLGEVSKTTTLQQGLADAGLATPGVPVTLGAQAATTLVNSTNLTVSAAIKSSTPTIKVSVPAYDASSISITITDETTLHYAAIAKDVNYTLTVNNKIGGGDISGTATVLYASATGILTVNGAVIALDSSFSIAGGQFQIQIKGSFGGQFRNGGGGGGGGGGASAVCFLGNAPVLTPTGYRRIDSLAVGDMVRTADCRDVAIQHVKHQRVIVPSGSVNPYVIPKGQFGATENLAISPRHAISVPGCGMVEARELGLRQMPMRAAFDYYNLELPEWDNMVVAGVEVESLAPTKRVVMSAAQFRGLVAAKGIRTEADLAKLAQLVEMLADGRVAVSLTQKTRRA